MDRDQFKEIDAWLSRIRDTGQEAAAATWRVATEISDLRFLLIIQIVLNVAILVSIWIKRR